MTRSRTVVAGLIALWLFATAFLLGRLAEKMWFDGVRARTLAELDHSVRRVHAQLMLLDRGAATVCTERRP